MGKRPSRMQSIAERLELTREALGLTPAQFARRIGISPQAYNNYIGLRRYISLDQAEKICLSVGVSLDWIYRGDMQTMRLDLASKIQALAVARKTHRA